MEGIGGTLCAAEELQW